MSNIFVVEDKNKKEILSYDGKQYLYQAEHDLTNITAQNAQRKNMIGAGWSQSRDLKEEFEIPADVYYSHPDCIEYAKTRNRAVMRRFLKAFPMYRTSTGSY